MSFKITKDMLQTALKKTVTTRKVAADSPVVQKEKAKKQALKDKILKPKSEKEKAEERVVAPALIKGEQTVKKIIPSDNRPSIHEKDEFRDFIQDLEARPEDFKPLDIPKSRKFSPDTEILSAGKRHLSVDSQAFGPTVEEFSKTVIEKNEKFVADPLRGRTGKYWTIDSKGKSFTFVGESVSSVNETAPIALDTYEAHNSLVNSDFGRTKQWSTIKGDKKKFKNAKGKYSRDLWQAYVQGGIYDGSSKNSQGKPIAYKPSVITGQVFFDHTYELSLPFTAAETKDLQVPLGALTAEIKPEYNFYIKDYENTVTKRKSVLDNTLPNLYVFLSELDNENPNPEFRNFITLDGTLNTEEQMLQHQGVKNKFDIKSHPIGQYYDLYAHQYEDAVKNGAVSRLNNKFSNISVPLEEIGLFNTYNEKSEMFPMLVDIRLGTDKTTTFAQILKDSQLTNAFMTRVINRHIKDEASILEAEVASEIVVQHEGGTKRKVSRFDSMKKRAWNIAELIEDLREGDEQLDPNRAIFLGNHDQETATLAGPEFKFFKSLMFSIFRGKLQTLIKQKARTLKEVMAGKEAYSETVMYRISKHEFGAAGAPIQSFWLPNSNEIDVLRFVDTQVKYNKRYVYKIWAYQMVIGTKYWHSELDVESYDHHASFMTHMEPSLMLVETPYLETTLRVTDKPPIPPDVDIIPYKGIDNEILFYLKGNVGEFDAEPVLIQPTDQVIFETIRESQKKLPDEEISFGSDDHASSFQIFRLENKPRSYADFTGNLQAFVDADISLETIQAATSAAFVDSIKPNIKYYYIVRAIDVHGHLSNPSPVYEVEIINENGMVFPTIRCVDFEQPLKSPDKAARRFIQIVPNVLQSLIDEEKSGYDNAKTAEDVKRKIHLGATTDSVWDKTFKIRLTSKSTGKKIELNVGFDHKHSEKA